MAHYFTEKEGDKRVKASLEWSLDLKIGPFITYVERYR
jgi:hypothetical protein